MFYLLIRAILQLFDHCSESAKPDFEGTFSCQAVYRVPIMYTDRPLNEGAEQ
ncbi:hypothetical protein ACWEHA_22335 [Amycolatopsis nivea]